MKDLSTDQLIEMGRAVRPETPKDAFDLRPSELVNALADRLAEVTGYDRRIISEPGPGRIS